MIEPEDEVVLKGLTKMSQSWLPTIPKIYKIGIVGTMMQIYNISMYQEESKYKCKITIGGQEYNAEDGMPLDTKNLYKIIKLSKIFYPDGSRYLPYPYNDVKTTSNN